MDRVDPTISFVMLVLPAFLFSIGLFQSRILIMLIAFIWGVPYGLFMSLVDGVYWIYCFVCLMYFICIALLRVKKVKYW